MFTRALELGSTLALIYGCSPAPAAQEQVNRSETFTCTPLKLWDGDGPIHCAEGPRIRLAGIAARELDGSCSPGHPCPAVEPIASRDHLARLLGRVTGTASEGHLLISGVSASPWKAASFRRVRVTLLGRLVPF